MPAVRSVPWVGSISDRFAMADQPISFSKGELQEQSDLFWHRSSLFFTPTESLPMEFLGRGDLDVTLPVASPDWNEAKLLRSYDSPRFWVDLLQRATFKIRWQPPAWPTEVAFIRRDYIRIRDDHMAAGLKALLDALKVGSSGHKDGRRIHYFGAIAEDDPKHLKLHRFQEQVEHPSNASIRVVCGEKASRLCADRTNP